MRRAYAIPSLAAFAFGFASCAPIEGTPPEGGPVNSCALFPCAAYAPNPARAECSTRNLCETPGRPERFFVVVQLPTTSFFAAGQTFVMTEADFTRTAPPGSRCIPPLCIPLPALADVRGGYTVEPAVGQSVGWPLSTTTEIPVRVSYLPIVRTEPEPLAPVLPVDTLFAASRLTLVDQENVVQFARPLPAGRYRRAFSPEPPFDAWFPPVIQDITIRGDGSDAIVLALTGSTPLDDPSGDTRLAEVTREEGLDGFTVWLADRASGQRISTLRPLSGTKSSVRVDTAGRPTFDDDVEAIVAPPSSFIAVPRFRTGLPGGQGLRNLVYPRLPAPVSLVGVVAANRGIGIGSGVLRSVTSKLTFSSRSIRLEDGAAQTLLEYRTTTSTDEEGRFATVLPPGEYDVTIEPELGTGYAITRRELSVTGAIETTLEPMPTTRARGNAVLTDGRPLTYAEVFAVPERPTQGASAAPRPARALTDATGAFELELDQGDYVVTVVPQEGTGFPRMVMRAAVREGEMQLPPVLVPAPSRLAFTLRESTSFNAIKHALVRIFADPSGGTASPVEVGSAWTDQEGKVEILLAQQPR